MNLIARQDEGALQALDEIAVEASRQVIANYGQFKQALVMAAAVRKMQEEISDPMMSDIMALQGTALGFRTDKDTANGYPLNVVKQCLIEATINGARPIGNEFNIISGRVYLTKEFYSRAVREWPGLSDLKLSPQVPVTSNGGALVGYRATWKLNGEPQSLDRVKHGDDDNRIPVKVNTGMGADAIIGKATRKMLHAIYGQLTGAYEALPEGEVGEDEPLQHTGARKSEVTSKILEGSTSNGNELFA